ncbi:MAG: hypothetical protein QOE91_659 [Gaiellaceae bacterium]|nr:hypothetical protein [Gaiellaceae bacterium]
MRRPIMVGAVVIACAATVAAVRTSADAAQKTATKEAAVSGWSNFSVAGTPPGPSRHDLPRSGRLRQLGG